MGVAVMRSALRVIVDGVVWSGGEVVEGGGWWGMGDGGSVARPLSPVAWAVVGTFQVDGRLSGAAAAPAPTSRSIVHLMQL